MRIGEFAQLGQLSVRMLRHYESMDLLTPDSVDPFSGHRSYTVAQLPRLNRIMALNALGISLRKIAVLLDSDLSTTELTGMLNLRRHQLRAEQSAAAAKLAEVEFRLTLIEGTAMNHPDCIIKELPAERVLGQTVVLGEPPHCGDSHPRGVDEPHRRQLAAPFRAVHQSRVFPDGPVPRGLSRDR